MRALLFETLTGKPVIDLERTEWSFDTGILAPDQVKITVPGYTPRSRSMDMRSLLVERKYSVALVDESVAGATVVAAAGPIISAPAMQDDDGKDVWKVTCGGPERAIESWHVRKFPGWPLIGSDGKPNGAHDMNLSGLEYGTIMKRLLQEGMKFPGGSMPFTFEPDRAGSRQHAYAAVDGKPVLEALDDLADLINGVEYDFVPDINDRDEMSWRFVTGTDAAREVVAHDHLLWNIGGARQDVRAYERTPQAGFTDAVFTGGKEKDKVMAARSTDAALLADGFPRRELWDSSHSSVSIQATLQAWADGALSGRADRIEFEVRAERAHGLRHGDVVTLAAQGHHDLADASYELRVLSVSRSSGSPDWVGVQLI